MSVGIGVGDFVVLLKAVGRLVSVLTNEAVDGFQKCTKTYQHFLQLVQGLTKLVQRKALQDDSDIKRSLRNTQRLLRHYFGRISEFKPYLGPNRVKKSLVGAIAKVKWVHHTDILRELRQDLDRELGLLYLLISIKPELHRAIPRSRRNRSEYIVILVTRPPIHSYGVVSDGVCTPPDQPRAIPWDSADPGSIPPMLPSLHFRRHFALCLMPNEVWSSQSKTLAEKFEGQLFWDYHGDNTKYSRGIVWSSDNIRNINAIQELGIALSGEDATKLCTEYYIEMRHKWTYFNIWWNAADFALSLACLLVDAGPAKTCLELMQRLTELRDVEVLLPREQSCETIKNASLAVSMGALALTVATGGLAAPVTIPAIAGGVACSIGSLTTDTALKDGCRERLELREAAIAELQQSFPRLDKLFT